MKKKEFVKQFIGAFIGILAFEIILDINDIFNHYWLDYLFEIFIMTIFVFLGILLMNYLTSKFSIFSKLK